MHANTLLTPWRWPETDEGDRAELQELGFLLGSAEERVQRQQVPSPVSGSNDNLRKSVRWWTIEESQDSLVVVDVKSDKQTSTRLLISDFMRSVRADEEKSSMQEVRTDGSQRENG